MPTKNTQGRLYEQSARFAADLDAGQAAASQAMLDAWTQGYWAVRQDMDALLAKVAAAKAAGQPTSPAWLYQQTRLKATLDATKREIARFAEYAAEVTTAQQASAIAAATKHAATLGKTAVAEQLGPDLVASFIDVDPKVLEAGVGFLADGSPLRDLLVQTMPAEAGEKVQAALVKGLAMGWSQDRMVRAATEAYGLSHTRAVTIMRTESLRAYRQATRATYMANQDTVGTWVWNAHLDARTCLSCAIMDGTEHPVDAILDGHPRCRCAMVPRTKTWDEILGKPTGLPDTRPPVRSGKAWLEAQPPHVQRAMMGPGKWAAWLDGSISLDDMVARTYHPRWGTMRTERSMKAIAEDRDANWFDVAATPPPSAIPPAPKPSLAHAKELAAENTLEDLKAWARDPGDTGPQALADLHAAIAYKLNRGPEQGPVLPRPDQAKVDAAVAKLEQAVWDKGYPSKGYSQTKAIYKAQAHGKPGTQVGVVKSLTWDQKVTAQAILDAHDAALPSIVRAAEKAKALDAAHAEALAIHKGLKRQEAITKAHDEALAIQAQADEAAAAVTKALDAKAATISLDTTTTSHHAAYKTALAEAITDAQDMLDATPPGSPAHVIAQARWQAAAAKLEQYDNAWDSMQAFVSTHWTHKGGSTGEVTPEGWFHLKGPEGMTLDMHLPPHQSLNIVTGSPDAPTEWEQVLVANPSQVKEWQKVWTDPDGYVIPGNYAKSEDYVKAGTLTPQQAEDLVEALAQTAATGKWKPEQPYVDKIVGWLNNGQVTADEVQAMVEAAAKPLSKANAKAALAQWQAAQAMKSVPVPKPVIPWGKYDLTTANAVQVNKIKAKVAAGELTLDDVYALWAKSKNKGPKTNYAKAIHDMDPDAKVQAAQTGPGAPASTTPAPPPAPKPAMPSQPPWKPEDLTDTGQRLGTHGAQVWTAPDGSRWLFKPPKNPQDGFLVTLDEAASRIQAMAGLKAPDTYVVTLGGKRGSIQRMFDATDGFPGGFKPSTLSPKDLDAVQREHVLDWLLSNHDGHRDQFLRLPDGTLTGIDKGQAFRWFGQDRLAWDFHPNGHYGTPEPVYNTLWREFAQGKGVDIDLDGLHRAIADVQAITDDDLRALLRPYAEQAAARGLLAKPQPSFPGVTTPSIQANDVEAFLAAVVKRKHDLATDFQALYDKAAKARAKAVPGWTPAAFKPATGKAKWVGKDKPTPPTPPEAPAAATEASFTPWVDRVAAKLKAYNGKDLKTSNNWARVRRVIDDLDRKAVQELKDRFYLDDDLAAEALALIDAAEAQQKTLQAAYAKAMADHAKAMDRYKADLGDWKDANGVKDLTQGMDDAVVRHGTDQAGVTWAQKHFDESRYTTTQRKWLKSYTGTAYADWNNHLRTTKGKPTKYAEAYKHIDNAMAAQPIPEDVILHRGTVQSAFELDGKTLGYGDDMTKIIGSVQVDWGYMSTSVGNSAAFSNQAVQLKIRAPAGTPGSYVQMFSKFSTERELILPRGTHMYVHNAYQKGGRWVVEVEVVPDDFDAASATPTPSAKPWST